MEGFIVNLIVEYDEKLDAERKRFDDEMNALHRDYVEHAAEQSLAERTRKSFLYKFAYFRWRLAVHKEAKNAVRTVEYDGRVFDIDWKDMSISEIVAAIERILEDEKEDASISQPA